MLRQFLLLTLLTGALGAQFRTNLRRLPSASEPNNISEDKNSIEGKDQLTGDAAGAGSAMVGGTGSAESINTADHPADAKKTQATGFNTADQVADATGGRESGTTLNAASGNKPQTQGATQASGATGTDKNKPKSSTSKDHQGRFRRRADPWCQENCKWGGK